eukprot:165947_1
MLLPFVVLFGSCLAIGINNPWIKPTLSVEQKKEILGKSKPNFLILFADDLGFGDLGFNGHPTITTPNLDHYAHEGMRLNQWYSGFHVCSPSRAAMLTGRLCVRSGCCGGWKGGVFRQGAKGGLPTNETTFATVLKKAGYATMAIGKWHLGVLPQFMPLGHGFDEYYGVPYSVDMGKSPWNEGGGFPPLPLVENETVIQQPLDLSVLSKGYLNAATTFIKKYSSNNTPWLLYFPLSHVHVPDYSSIEYCNTSIRGFFGAAMTEMDDLIGQVMKSLTTLGVENNTLTFFTSDNGPWLTQRIAGGSAGLFRNGKETTWEGGFREPAFAHWPGMIDAKSISYELTATYDIFTTIINVANATQYLPNDNRVYDGKDMSDILFFNGKSQHECIYYYGGDMPTPYTLNGNGCPYNKGTADYPKCQGLWAVRCGEYKAHWVTTNGNGSVTLHDPPELYNVNWDPSELHPIYKSNVQYKNIINTLNNSRIQHLATLDVGITNQIELGTSNDNVFCMDPNSQNKYPNYPNCTGTPDNWNQFICQPVCLDFDRCGNSVPGYTF